VCKAPECAAEYPDQCRGLARIASGKPVGEHFGPMPFAAWQTAFDPLLAPGARNYWKSHDFKAITGDVEKVVCDAVSRLPSGECEVFIGHPGAAVNRVAAGDTAYPHRDVEFVINVHTRWREPGQDAQCIAWARQLFDALTPYATGGDSASFSSLSAGGACLNLIAEPTRAWSWWGRIVFYVSDVDALFARAVDRGLQPEAPPRDATWGERYFHITDPDGHELSFARRLT
jgi:catechol 2,3-dioxygenase-like lactoylglutathione lyase family enzyme